MSAGKKSTAVLSLLLLLLLWIFPAQAQDISDKLDATFTTADGSISFRYIGDWHIRSGSLTVWTALSVDIGSKEILLDVSQPTTGEIKMSIRAGYDWHANSLSRNTSGPHFTSAMDVMTYHLDELRKWRSQPGFDSMDIYISDITETTLAGEEAAYLSVLTQTLDQLYLIVWYQDGFSSLFTLTTVSSELEKWQPIVLAVAESFTFDFDTILSPEEWQASPSVANSVIAYNTSTFPELPLTYSASDGNFTFDYPMTWFSNQVEYDVNPTIIFSTDPDLLDGRTLPKPESGQVGASVTLFDIKNSILNIAVDASPVEVLQAYFRKSHIGFITSFGFNLIQPITINNRPAGLATSDPHFSNPSSGNGLVITVILENGYVGVLLVTAPFGELNLWQDTALAIAASMQYRPD